MTTQVNPEINSQRYESNEPLKIENGTFQEDVKANGINFVNVTALKKIVSLREFSAIDSKLGRIKAQSNVNVTNSRVVSVVSENGKITLQNQKTPKKSVHYITGTDSIELEHVKCSGTIKSLSGNVIANQIKAKKIWAKNFIRLMDCQARSVESNSGKIHWENRRIPREPAESIKANGGIVVIRVKCLKDIESLAEWVMLSDVTARNIFAQFRIECSSVICEMITSKNGSVTIKKSSVKNILAYDSIYITNSIAENVISRNGLVTISHEEAHKVVLQSVKAKKTIDLNKIDVDGEINSENGSVTVTQGKVKTVIAKDKINLKNSEAESAVSLDSSIKISNRGPALFVMNEIQAKLGIQIERVRCSSRLVSQLGNVSAILSDLQEIEANHSVFLHNSNCKSIFLRVFQNTQVELDFTNSIIDGDLVVDIQPRIGAVQNVQCTVLDNKFTIVSNTEFDSLDFLFPGLKDGCKGTINDLPFKFENGKFIPIGKLPEKTPNEVMLKIKGGIISGRVGFLNGNGKYELLENASVRGGSL